MPTTGPSTVWDTVPLVGSGFYWGPARGLGAVPAAVPAGALLANKMAGGVATDEYKVAPKTSWPAGFDIGENSDWEATEPDGTLNIPFWVYKNGAILDDGLLVLTTGSTATPTVTGVTATPSAANLAGGASVKIVTTVAGLNNPSQSGAWAKVSGVGSVIQDGTITAPAATSSQQTGLFRFIPTQDANYHVDVVLTVAALAPGGDTTRPVMVGAISPSAITASSFTVGVQAATDNVAIKEYKWRINGGAEVSTGLTRTKSYSGLAEQTSYNIECLAYDTSDNAALVPLTLDVVTLVAPPITDLVAKTLAIVLKTKDQVLRPNVTGINWAWSDSRGVITSSGSGLSSNGAGQISIPILTALLSDGIGFLSLDNYNGGNSLDYFGFFGPVRVP